MGMSGERLACQICRLQGRRDWTAGADARRDAEVSMSKDSSDNGLRKDEKFYVAFGAYISQEHVQEVSLRTIN
jgi:hypothetical protein